MKHLILACATVCIAAGSVACAAPPRRSPPIAVAPLPSATPLSVPTPALTPTLTPSAQAMAQRVFDWRTPASWPAPKVPEDNPITEEKFQLGRFLFYDERLSGNGAQSCSSCHIQALAFSDGREVSIGSTGDKHPRNAQALVNVAYNATLTWANPILDTIEKQVQIPMFGEFPIELGITGKEQEVLDRLKADPRYRRMFAAAFSSDDDPINYRNVVYALASFTRGLISANSPYDRYVAGDRKTMSESAQRGMALFLSERLECNHCHSGFNLSVSTTQAGATFDEKPFFNTGLYNIDGAGAYPPDNPGLMELTTDPTDMGRFRPPTLRNIALTAPYMHDGSLKTLEDVIAFYGRGGRKIGSGPYAGDGRLSPFKSGLIPGFQITVQERQDLLAFLGALTDETFVSDPRYSDPFAPQP